MARFGVPKTLVAGSLLLLGCSAILGIGELDVDKTTKRDSGSPVDAADADRTSPDGGGTPPSCGASGPGLTTCGTTGAESCCASPLVPGGTFFRDFDKVLFTSTAAPATVSSFRLDRFEITVARFRRFVAAVGESRWRPPPGSGKHIHLNAGLGLTAAAGKNEGGWDSSWDALLPATSQDWATALVCVPLGQTWGHSSYSASSAGREAEAMNCITWFDAYAFCIWDGGFLPSEAEWNYAAAGGGGATGQRVYPWSNPPTNLLVDCNRTNHGDGGAVGASACPPTGPHVVGANSPLGDGAFTHADLGGNLGEWTLDWYSPTLVVPCDDCGNFTTAELRTNRGGSFAAEPAAVTVSTRGAIEPNNRPYFGWNGARCARSP